MNRFSFSLLATDPSTAARRGRLQTAHGMIETPVFMPVGTLATVKGMSPDELRRNGAQIILGNTYHLFLRPGHERIAQLGGLHRFMGWDGPILTDSGGYQVFSLGALRKISEEGVTFRSHIDGAACCLTPENTVAIQEALGSDIMMQFDECIPYPADRAYTARSMERSLRWAQRCQAACTPGRTLFGIVQGGMERDLRMESAQALTALAMDGYAIGGLSVGEPKEQMLEVLSYLPASLPADKPRYLMGVGRPEDLVAGVAAGIDMFDCVMPTRNARNGQMFVPSGVMNIKQARYRDDPAPPDEQCGCATCRQFSRAYLNHLFHSGEMLGLRLMTQHNLYYYADLMRSMRTAIEQGCFESFQRTFYAGINDTMDPINHASGTHEPI
ncbi:MAG: tRNA guanosine(34) transglycosylase Tgt [Magnetococcales bacterium]|nr:tRNA guanosine(34) transglycosylase Tgt [Magnetococcales bacterium]